MPTAHILLHQSPHYRREAFTRGLQAHGYQVSYDRGCARPQSEDDVLVIWNRQKPWEAITQEFENAKCTVLVAENSYFGPGKAIARFHHNGAGDWPWSNAEDTIFGRTYDLAPDRRSLFGLDNPAPWRKDGRHILVLPQRGIGEPGIASPRNWEQHVLLRLKKLTDRPIRVRKHPGKNPATPLEEDLRGAWAAVTWGSGAGIKALASGIPVFYDLSTWIGAPAASSVWDIENPTLGDRDYCFRRLSWAQWLWEEIESGEAFKWLL